MDTAQLITFLSPTAPRRLRVIENILVGKRTVSTLYWGMRYHQLSWLGYEKRLTRNVMDQTALELKNKGLVTVEETNAQLTELGAIEQQRLLNKHYQPKYLNLRLIVDVEALWQRLLLATQVVSEQAYQNKHYYPLQVSWQVKQFVKRWFHQFYSDDLRKAFQDFWQTFLSQLPNDQALLMSRLLVGHQRPGETLVQVAHDFELTESEVRVMITDLICQLAKVIAHTETASLRSLLAGLSRSLISTSAQQTLNSFMAGKSLEVISHQRQLKLSTVREHLLEAAIMLPPEQFDFQRILPAQLVTQMLARLAKTPLDQWQFTQVADLSVEFWQFRLLEILRSKQTDDKY
ncbi:helix-turn-helix domain-containing protein [Secundilactobacillus hailunensis]|uniref:Helix-turn-helix domain-containing protein n=1 Tax=Secundilactobacillus hailunensis TaxID=2559923 RepID=A0ABW1T7C5_9LACO|nr:helix-turn-helix domain-containing protein [Secundilactobacillus hailunensis]